MLTDHHFQGLRFMHKHHVAHRCAKMKTRSTLADLVLVTV